MEFITQNIEAIKLIAIAVLGVIILALLIWALTKTKNWVPFFTALFQYMEEAESDPMINALEKPERSEAKLNYVVDKAQSFLKSLKINLPIKTLIYIIKKIVDFRNLK